MKNAVKQTLQNANIARLIADGSTAGDVSRETRLSERTVRRRARELGLVFLKTVPVGRPRGPAIRPAHVTAPLYSRAWWSQCDTAWRQHIETLRRAAALQPPTAEPARVTVHDIATIAAIAFGVSPQTVFDGDLRAAPTFARQVAAHIAVSEFHMGKSRVGRALKRNRKTAHYADRKIDELRQGDFDLQQKIEEIAFQAQQLARSRVKGAVHV